MFKPAEKTKLSQISLTGMRAIILVGLLIEGPKTLDEIRDVLISLNIMELENSDDVIRIDLNTLRTLGCEITKADYNNNYKYKLINHPFSLNIMPEEIAVIKKAYRKIKDSADISLLIKYDKLFRKIAKFAGNEDIREELYGISVLKSYKISFITGLLKDCKLGNKVKLVYHNPSSKFFTEKEIIANRLVFQNDKIYLYGYDTEKKRFVVLNIKKIKSIISRILGNDNIQRETINVKFILKKIGVINIEENEKIIESSDEGFLIEGTYCSEFFAIQRMLSFGSDCIVLEPENLKNKIIQKLQKMRDVYND